MKWLDKKTVLSATAGFAFAIAAMVGSVALAHGGAHGKHGKRWTPEKIEKHITKMKQELGLSDTQEENVRAIMAGSQQKFQTLKEQERSPEKFREMRQIKWDTEDQVHEVLTCEQREGLRKMKREHRAERMEKRFQHRRERGQGAD